MSEPTEPKPVESADMPGELNAPAPTTSQSPAQAGEIPEDVKQPLAGPDLAPGSTQDSQPNPTSSTVTNDPGNTSDQPTQDTSHPPSAPNFTTVSIDNSQPGVGSSAAPDHSLPAIDTTLPSLDSSLPAIGTDIHTIDMQHSFGDDSHFGHHGHNTGSVDSGNNATQQPESTNGSSHYQAPTNDSHQYAQNPGPSQQGNDQRLPPSHSQHQFQSQPQPQQNYHQQSPEVYHHTSGFSAVNNNNNNEQQQPGQVPQAPIGSPMPPMSSVGQYMTGYPSNAPQGMDQNSQMRYQLPGDPNKLLSGSRHKKEIKRRTKTGCLTCRKRRIKCDEGHPVCRNCVKSKRECLGYDPVFRPQATAPSAIQPAPNPPPSLVVKPQGAPPQSSLAYPSAPPGYMPASSQPFAPAIQSESPSTSTDVHEHRASVDSSLGNPTQISSNMQNTVDPRPPGFEAPFRAAKNIQVNDLLSLRGIDPPAPHPIGNLPPGRLEEIQAVFLATYAPAIDKLLEVRWYSEKALSTLMADAQLMADYSALINAFNDWNLSDTNTVARLESFEASVVWRSMALCRQASNGENGQYGQDWNLVAANARLNAIEALLTWNHSEHNALSREQDAAKPPNSPDQFIQRQLDFWSELGTFLTLYDNEASSAKLIDDTLGRCRQLLDTYENRDIIYSIAVARHLGQRWADFPNSLPNVGTTNEKESGTKLFVAQKFIEEEAEGKGTTQIYKRVCCMAVRSWWVARQ